MCNSYSAWATINKINRLAAALRCSSLCRIATPCQDLASKDSIDSENKSTLQHAHGIGSPMCAEKMQDWEAWVRGQRIAMTIWYDPERSIRIWCLHADDGLSFPYRLQKFPLFLSSSYRLQKFADTDRLRVNRKPIRKDFFPDRYDFVPIVFTSSSCKRGLNLPSAIELSETAVFVYNFVLKPYASEQLRWHIWPTFPLNFFMKFSQKMRLYFFYTMVQKSQKWPKTQIKGGSCLKPWTQALIISICSTFVKRAWENCGPSWKL